MAILFFDIMPFVTRKIYPQQFFAKVGSKYYKTLSKPLKVCLRLLTFGQSGEISPNLVTLYDKGESDWHKSMVGVGPSLKGFKF